MDQQFYKTKKEITTWLNEIGITNYNLFPNYNLVPNHFYGFIVDVEEDVNLPNVGLSS